MTPAGVAADIEAIAADFATERAERQQRRELDPADFERLRAAGLQLASLPFQYGGLWTTPAESMKPLCELFRILAQGDSSVALVATMHHAVLRGGGWLSETDIPGAYQEAWQRQTDWVVETVCDGAWWGTIVSEPGSGGDPSRTKSGARKGGDGWRLSGLKHFGTGTGVTSYMITEAIPEGESEPDVFILDMRGVPVDGSAGVDMIAPWNGHGMTATQSHSLLFRDFPAQRAACPKQIIERVRGPIGGINSWVAIATGICQVAMDTARSQLSHRAEWRALERAEWSRAEAELWLIEQAYEGMLRDVVATGGKATVKAKMAVADLSESLLRRLCQVVGGSTFNRSSPFGCWYEDVRALGFLRPPWGMAFDGLFQASWS